MNYPDFEVMKKYRKSKVLDGRDEYTVSRLENIGWMRTGWRDNTTNEELKSHLDSDLVMRTTASLTSSGKEAYYLECIRRNPIRRFWHNLVHSF